MNTVSQAPLILITGGGRGVGAATARLAAAQGYDVAISFVSNESAALAVAAENRSLSYSLRSTGSSAGSMCW
jgi:NAD(P)-dependent dehydrogenase (short-subunit alcohol dehydrogenase family)